MFTMEKAANLHAKFAEFFEAGKIAAALCHGVAVLRYATLSNGDPLVKGRTVTGFTNIEEDFVDEAIWSARRAAEGHPRHAVAHRGRNEQARGQLHPSWPLEGLRHP